MQLLDLGLEKLLGAEGLIVAALEIGEIIRRNPGTHRLHFLLGRREFGNGSIALGLEIREIAAQTFGIRATDEGAVEVALEAGIFGIEALAELLGTENFRAFGTDVSVALSEDLLETRGQSHQRIHILFQTTGDVFHRLRAAFEWTQPHRSALAIQLGAAGIHIRLEGGEAVVCAGRGAKSAVFQHHHDEHSEQSDDHKGQRHGGR